MVNHGMILYTTFSILCCGFVKSKNFFLTNSSNLVLLKMKKLFLTFLILALSPLLSGADTVILKNGMRFESDKIWQEGNEIKCIRNGIVIGFLKDDVERIDRTANQMPPAEPPPLRAGKLHKTPSEAAENTVPATEQITDYDVANNKRQNELNEAAETAPAVAAKSPEFNFDESKKRFERIQKELDMAYQTILKVFEQLETDKKRLKPGTATIKYNERVLRYYQNLKDYERKRKAFNIEVEAYKTRAEKESYKQLLDDENFSMLLESDGNRQYLFVIEVTPSFSRKILFLTNPAGKIIEFRTDVEKNSNALQ